MACGEFNAKNGNGGIIFRRYRKGRNGKVYDAYDYGLKAWPIRVKVRRNKR